MKLELEVVHDTRYDYAAAVSVAHHLAHLQPMQDNEQQLLAFDLAVEPSPTQRTASVDSMGNAQLHFSLAQPHRRLHVVAKSRVQLAPRWAGLQAQASPPWDEVASSLRYVGGAPYVPALEFALPSPYVPRLQALRDYGAPSFEPGRPVAAVAIELMQRVHADFLYQSQSTDVDTPLATVLEQRRGVCQDFAHLLAGVLRMWGLPARYVSGYLLTQPPAGGAPMVGADASHAWVQVWCPGTPGVRGGWLDLDPTNRVLPDTGHVRVAVGRDFGDVTPLRGVIRGGGRHTLTVGVSTRRLAEAEMPAGGNTSC
jgi:transglutaminase-like putative cysteine protease